MALATTQPSDEPQQLLVSIRKLLLDCWMVFLDGFLDHPYLVAWWVNVIIDSRYEIEWIRGRLMGFLIIHSWLLDGLLNHVANASYSTGM